MSALAGDGQLFPGYCPHKRATACGLTATFKCCACADRRPHAPAYSVYIDGLGSVLRGTRWERYCWACKAFWEARVASSPLRPAETRIPDVPDQTGFLTAWHEFRREAENQGVMGDRLAYLTPGHISPSLDEVRASQPSRASSTSAQRDVSPALPILGARAGAYRNTPSEPGQTSQSWIADATPRSNATQPQEEHMRPSEHQARRLMGLRRDLRRMRRGIERIMGGLHELGENMPEARQVATAGSEMDRQLAIAEGELLERQDSFQPLLGRERARPSDAAALHAALDRHDRLEAEHRSADRLARVFGSREEIERQGPDYESPIGGMFARAWGRYREREQERSRDRSVRDVLAAEDRLMTEFIETEESDVRNAERDSNPDYSAFLGASLTEQHFPLVNSQRDRATAASIRPRDASPLLDGDSTLFPRVVVHGEILDDDQGSDSDMEDKGLDDEDDGRPTPRADSDMIVSLECKICYSQLADTAVLPCGHFVMCQWCAEKHMPSLQHDKTRPRRSAKCPLCRKRVKQKVKIYRG